MRMKYNPFQATGKYQVNSALGETVEPPRYLYHLDFAVAGITWTMSICCISG